MNNILKYALLAAGAWWLLKDQFSFGAAAPSASEDSTQSPAENTSAPDTASAPKSQSEIDDTEYAAALATVQSFTKTGYSTGQLAQIEQWFYNEAGTYKANNGNLNHFTGWIVLELPKYVEVVKKAVPGNDDLMNAAFDKSKASLTGAYKLSGHQWNWYRAQRAIALGIFNESLHQPNIPGLDSQMTAAEYHAVLSGAGLGRLVRTWR